MNAQKIRSLFALTMLTVALFVGSATPAAAAAQEPAPERICNVPRCQVDAQSPQPNAPFPSIEVETL